MLRQRKCKQKKGDRRLALWVLTLRFSIICVGQKNGKSLQLAALRQQTFLIHFLPHTNYCVSSGLRSKSTAISKEKKNTPNLTSILWIENSYFHQFACLAFDVDFDFDFDFDSNPLLTLPIVHSRKWIRKRCCLSETSFNAFPFFVMHNWEPEGQW